MDKEIKNMKITKQEIEEQLGYEINDFKVDSIILHNEGLGVSIQVHPKRTISKIEHTITITKESSIN